MMPRDVSQFIFMFGVIIIGAAFWNYSIINKKWDTPEPLINVMSINPAMLQEQRSYCSTSIELNIFIVL